MFDKLIRELKNLDGMEVGIPMEVDKDGYSDRGCPEEECSYKFKVLEKDWSDLFRDEAVYCPYCRNEALSELFFTREQIEHGKEQIGEFVESRIDKALRDGARDFNRKQPKSGFLTMSVSVSGLRKEKIMLPIPAKEALEQKVQCEKCKARYAVIGIAFFCPCCGHNSVERTFSDTMAKIKDSIKNLPAIKASLSEISKDEAETTCITLLEKGLTDCVVGFQRYCEKRYKSADGSKSKVPRNAFQNLNIGEDLWKSLLDSTYSDWLKKEELVKLHIQFQRRHLLQHTEGIVDSEYLVKTGDNKYKKGQRIVVREKDVIELCNIVEKLVDALKDLLDGSKHSNSFDAKPGSM